MKNFNFYHREICNTDLYRYGYEKYFRYDGYGDCNKLNLLSRKFPAIVCEVIDLYDNEECKSYNSKKKKLHRKTSIKMKFYYYDYYGKKELIPFKFIKKERRKIRITISQFNSQHFHNLIHNIFTIGIY